MTRINLLPWRETHRKETNNEFYVVLGLCMAIAAGIGFGGYKFAEGKVDFQAQRNARLKSEIALLQAELKEIEALEETKNNLLARMEIIQQLQGRRPQIVHTFHELAKRLPDGVYLTSMKQNGDKLLVLEGKSESNARVSALMRRMDRSEYLASPRLEVIEQDKADRISSFRLSLVQERPDSDETEENSDGLQ